MHILSSLLLISAAFAAPSTYDIRPSDAGYSAGNPAQRLAAQFSAGRATFRTGPHRFSLSLAGAGPVVRTTLQGGRIAQERPGITEWYVNEPQGFEHGFTLDAKPGAGPIELRMTVEGTVEPRLRGGDVVLYAGGTPIFGYTGLRSWDADGRDLPSRVTVRGSSIHILVDDAGARYPVTIDPVVQQAKLAPGDGAIGDDYGHGVTIDGDTLVAGSPDHDLHGAAYVYVRAAGSWTLQAKLTVPEVDRGDFGSAVAISGDTIVVGAPAQSGMQGRAYVFTRSGTTWSLQASLTVADLADNDQFGSAVAISGGTAAVGAPARSGYAGRVYLFSRSGSIWTQQAELSTAAGGMTGLGYALSLSSGTLLATAPLENGFAGAAYVFTQSGGAWAQTARLAASDASAAALFGVAGALDGDTAFIGAPGATMSAVANAGAVYVFARSGGVWAQQVQLAHEAPEANDQFGYSLALSGTMALAGARGRNGNGVAYVFLNAGGAWLQHAQLTPADATGGDLYAAYIALSGDTVVVGAEAHNYGVGAVYVHRIARTTVASTPPGRTFALSGPGCGRTGTFTAPYTGVWSNCTVQWTSPDESSPGSRFAFQQWADGNPSNPRAFTPDSSGDATITAQFQAQYFLTTQVSPPSGGAITGSGYYQAGASATVTATPAPGFVFTGFTGALSGGTTPANLTMNGPATVTANFVPTPPAALSAVVTAKSGTSANRQWTITVTNNGPGVGYNTQLFGLMLTQTFGAACTISPVRLTPSTFPVLLGTLNSAASAQSVVVLNFSGCPANARFTAAIGYMSNGGSSAGLIQLTNQVQ